MPPRRTSRAAITLTEALVATLIFAIVAVPLVGLVVTERNTAVKAHLMYQALLAAREEIYDIRFLLAAGTPRARVAHGWKRVSGNAVGRLGGVWSGNRPGLDYTQDQERLETRVSFKPGNGRLWVGSIEARFSRPDGRGSSTGAGDPVLALSFGALEPKRGGR
jgi:type II secretory pathway pseudopilin PulG